MGAEQQRMEVISTVIDEHSTRQPARASAPTEPSPSKPAGTPSDGRADDWDLRALDVTAGEPD